MAKKSKRRILSPWTTKYKTKRNMQKRKINNLGAKKQRPGKKIWRKVPAPSNKTILVSYKKNGHKYVPIPPVTFTIRGKNFTARKKRVTNKKEF